VTDAAMDRLAELGYDPLYGARPLKRVIRKELEDQLARAMLLGEVSDGQTVVVDVGADGHLQVRGERDVEVLAVTPEADAS
jgi:ATP-dependent Clp protease ATP-binding subunit ClpB